MSEQLVEWFKEEFKNKESRIEELIRENERVKMKKDRIDVLWIYPEAGLKKVVGPNFFERLNRENNMCEIKAQITSDTTLKQILENIDEDYLQKFHILVVGSCDYAGLRYYEKSKEGFTTELVNKKFMKFQKNGGKILFAKNGVL